MSPVASPPNTIETAPNEFVDPEMILLVKVSEPSSVANCRVVVLNLPLNTLLVVLYQISPDAKEEGSELFPNNLISAFALLALNICLLPKV